MITSQIPKGPDNASCIVWACRVDVWTLRSRRHHRSHSRRRKRKNQSIVEYKKKVEKKKKKNSAYKEIKKKLKKKTHQRPRQCQLHRLGLPRRRLDPT